MDTVTESAVAINIIQLPSDPAKLEAFIELLDDVTRATKNITTPCRKCGRSAELFPKIGGPSCRKCAAKGK